MSISFIPPENPFYLFKYFWSPLGCSFDLQLGRQGHQLGKTPSVVHGLGAHRLKLNPETPVCAQDPGTGSASSGVGFGGTARRRKHLKVGNQHSAVPPNVLSNIRRDTKCGGFGRAPFIQKRRGVHLAVPSVPPNPLFKQIKVGFFGENPAAHGKRRLNGTGAVA